MADVANQAPSTDEEIPDWTLSPWRGKLDSTFVREGPPALPASGSGPLAPLMKKECTSIEALGVKARSYSPAIANPVIAGA